MELWVESCSDRPHHQRYVIANPISASIRLIHFQNISLLQRARDQIQEQVQVRLAADIILLQEQYQHALERQGATEEVRASLDHVAQSALTQSHDHNIVSDSGSSSQFLTKKVRDLEDLVRIQERTIQGCEARMEQQKEEMWALGDLITTRTGGGKYYKNSSTRSIATWTKTGCRKTLSLTLATRAASSCVSASLSALSITARCRVLSWRPRTMTFRT